MDSPSLILRNPLGIWTNVSRRRKSFIIPSFGAFNETWRVTRRAASSGRRSFNSSLSSVQLPRRYHILYTLQERPYISRSLLVIPASSSYCLYEITFSGKRHMALTFSWTSSRNGTVNLIKGKREHSNFLLLKPINYGIGKRLQRFISLPSWTFPDSFVELKSVNVEGAASIYCFLLKEDIE